MPQTLADILNETAQREKSHEIRLAAERANTESAEAARDWKLAETFFQTARETFTRLITTRVPIKEVGILVGNTGSRSENNDIYSLFQLYSQKDSSTFFRPTSKYFPLWNEFSSWAKSQGLEVVWEYQWDGGGIHSWYVLQVKALPSAHRSSGANAPRTR